MSSIKGLCQGAERLLRVMTSYLLLHGLSVSIETVSVTAKSYQSDKSVGQYGGGLAQKNGGRHRDLRFKGKHPYPMHGTIPGVPCISATLVHHTPHDTESTKEPHTEGTDMTLTLTVTDTLTNTGELTHRQKQHNTRTNG